MKKSERLGFIYIFSERTVSSSLDMAGSKEVAGIRPWYQMIRAIHAHHEVQKLVTFMDGLLSKLSVEFPAANSPTPRSMEIDNGWQRRGLKWKPSTLDTKMPIFIISSVIDHLPLITTILAA